MASASTGIPSGPPHPTTQPYLGNMVGTICKGVPNISYFGQIQDQWTPGAPPITPNANTLWALGSCTKSFTATLLGMLVNNSNGALTPNSLIYPLIKSYLPSGTVPATLQSITLEQLASMTAGLTDIPKDQPVSEVETLFKALMEPGTYNTTPGVFNYSDLSYALLSFGLVAYAVSPAPSPDSLPGALLELFDQYILTPLAMPSATFYPPQQSGSYNLPFGNSGATQTNGSKSNWPAYDGAGALYMTATDLMMWLKANMAGTVPNGGTTFVQSDPVSTLQSNGNTYIEGQFITRGWFTNTFTGPKSGKQIVMVTKNGAIPGFKCGIGFQQPRFPGGWSEYGVVVAYNSEQATLPAIETALDGLINPS